MNNRHYGFTPDKKRGGINAKQHVSPDTLSPSDDKNSNNINNNTLHHRTTSPVASRKMAERTTTATTPSTNRKRPSAMMTSLFTTGRLIRMAGLAAVMSLVVGAIYFHLHALPSSSSFSQLDNWNLPMLTQEDIWESRARERRRRTRPPPHNKMDMEDLVHSPTSYDLPTLQSNTNIPHRSNQRVNVTTTSDGGSSSLSLLCGVHAPTAAKKHPEHFQKQDALNSDSRVVITGILNQLGFHLALALHQQCGVTHIFGMDPFFPDSPKDRMMAMDRYAILTKEIVHFQKLTVPLVGLHSPQHFHYRNGGEFDIVRKFQPTHIVHLASFSEEGQYTVADGGVNTTTTDWRYVTYDHPFHPLRNSIVSMEQILNSIRRHDTNNNNNQGKKETTTTPHLVYTTSLERDALQTMYGTTTFLNEALASSYHALFGIFSIGLRLSNVYGPWGHKDAIIAELAQRVIQNNTNMTASLEEEWLTNQQNDKFLFVEDAVDAIIASMQYRRPNDVVTLDLLPKDSSTLSTLSGFMMEYFFGKQNKTIPTEGLLRGTNNKKENDKSRKTTMDCIGWKPATSTREGVKKHLAWHFAQAYPYGNHPVEGYRPYRPPSLFTSKTDNKHNGTLSSTTTTEKHLPRRFPCASECSYNTFCDETVFDDVIAISRNTTKNCSVVLYMVNLWPDFADLNANSTPSEYPEIEARVCKVAFVSATSPVVKVALASSRGDSGYDNNKAQQSKTFQDTTTTLLNGQIVVNGWSLVWIPADASGLTEAEYTLLKLSPRKLFHDNIAKAVYVEPRWFPPPSTNAIVTLSKLVDAKAVEAKRKKQYRSGTNIFKFTLDPPHAARRSILFGEEQPFPETVTEDSRVSALAEYILERNGIEETSLLTTQLQLYEHAVELIKTAQVPLLHELQPPRDDSFPFQWLRSVWMIHDFKTEQGRLLRCEWYDEQIFWGNNFMEDLSLAYVLAKRRLTGRHGLAIDEQGEWIPLTRQGVNGEEPVTDTREKELFLRLISKKSLLFQGKKESSREYIHGHNDPLWDTYAKPKEPLLGEDIQGTASNVLPQREDVLL